MITPRITAEAPILTARLRIRDLEPADATDAYLGWFRNADSSRFIHTAARMQGLAELRGFVSQRCNSDAVRFFGLFDNQNGLHVGNIKYEPIDAAAHTAVLGVMIGEPAYRGTGLFQEAFAATSAYLQSAYGIHEFQLGVDRSNEGAIRAYRKAGFAEMPGEGSALRMRHQLPAARLRA